MRTLFLIFLGLVMLRPLSVWAEPAKPNVIFILVDDMGWGDLGVFYQNDRESSKPKFATPNLDIMAAEGIQLRRHYTAAPVCAPARSSLISGVHQGHSNVRDNQFDKALEDNHTLGTVMKEAGYATANIGKWGVQGANQLPAPARPGLRGFDYFFGYLEHGDAHFHYPADTSYGGREINVYDNTTDITSQLSKCYSTDLFTARAKKWILDQNTNEPDKPFFLYLAYTAPHARLDVPTQAYPAGLGETGGLQWIGTPGNMINTASGTVNSYIYPDYASQGWNDTAKRHATMIRRLDHAVADIIQTLKDRGIDENTLIVFTSDNGPHDESGNGGSFTQDPRFFGSYGPMDGLKRDSWEGGIRVPTLVRWPNHIVAGEISTSASQFHDWMPTLAQVAGLPGPARSDGVSLLPTLITGTGAQRESTIYVEYNGNQYKTVTPNYAEFELSRRGVRRQQEQVIHLDGYKGIRNDISSATDDFQIYDTLTDPKETTDLAGTSADFIALQQRMKDRVLQLRRPGDKASRPYDDELIPAVTVTNTVPGLNYRAFEGSYPWVPDFTPISPVVQGISTGLDLSVRTRDHDIGLEYTGYLDVPTEGTYTFYLQTNGRAFMRLHDASIIDADFGYTSGAQQTASVRLKAGKHPIRLSTIQGSTGTPSLTLEWSGSGITKQPIPAANLLRVSVGVLIAKADAVTVIADTPQTIDVLVNDSIGSGPGPLAITSFTQPTHGVAAFTSGDTQILYSPDADYTGPDSFTYTVTDGDDSATATVTITVMAAIPPTATPDEATTSMGTAVIIDVLANDSTGSGPGPLTITAVFSPAHGSSSITSGGTEILYAPAENYTGSDSFTYTVSDGAKSATGTVTINVTALTPPTANSDGVTTPAGASVIINVLANDSIGSGPGPLTITEVSSPAHGSSSITSGGTEILYTPTPGYTGSDSFTYIVSDGQDSATGTVTVTVLEAIADIWLPLDETSGTTASDPLGRPLGTLQNFPANPWTTGRLGGALAFDGVDDHVVLTGEKGITGTAARTVTFWINADATQTGGTRPTMISWGNNNVPGNTSPGTRFDINLKNSDAYQLRAEFNSTGVDFTTLARSDLRGAGWVHCAIVVPANAKVSDVLGYLDGVAATGSGADSTAINTSSVNDITLGRMADGGSGRAFKGLLDDVRIFPRALAAGEIAQLAAQSPHENASTQWFFQHTGNAFPTTDDWEADTDHDGFNATLEFALGGNPNLNSTAIAPVLTENLDFVFNRRREGISPDDYVVETSTDLKAGAWQASSGGTVTPHPTLEGFDQITVPLSEFAGEEAIFVRLRVYQ